MTDPDVPSETLATIEVIAGAIRQELGEEIDAYPGRRDPEGADPLNRAFRAVVRALLSAAGVHDDHLAEFVSHALLVVATSRLEPEGYDARQIKALIEEEPGRPDDWLSFVTLSSRAQIEPRSRSRPGLAAIAVSASAQASGDGIGRPFRFASKHAVR